MDILYYYDIKANSHDRRSLKYGPKLLNGGAVYPKTIV